MKLPDKLAAIFRVPKLTWKRIVIELVPVLEDLPTWTACVIAVIVLRRREQRHAPPPASPEKPAIEI
jgi:hypothetical protein